MRSTRSQAHLQFAVVDHDRDPEVVMAAILACEADDALGKQILVGPEDGPIVLCASGLAQDAGGKAL
jgi:hypothetical protein